MAADVERLVTRIRDLHAAFDSGEWEPSQAEHACAVRILEAVAKPVAVSCAAHLRRSVSAGGQVRDGFLGLLRKITGSPEEGAMAVVRR
ncbi:hypothetical protein ACVNF4_07430 [Streptomyces sp. S6]